MGLWGSTYIEWLQKPGTVLKPDTLQKHRVSPAKFQFRRRKRKKEKDEKEEKEKEESKEMLEFEVC